MTIKHLCIAIILLSFALLVPGLTRPIFELSLTTKLNSKVANFETKVLDEKRSVLNTVNHLFENKRYLVAILIFLFSVFIPVAKGLLLLLAILKKNLVNRKKILAIVVLIAKWSMADVFVVAVFLAFLATSELGVDYNTAVNIMGMNLPIKINTVMVSNFGSGFYFFLSYCILSIISSQLAHKIK